LFIAVVDQYPTDEVGVEFQFDHSLFKKNRKMNYKGTTGENTIDKPKSICPLCNSFENSVSNHFKIKDCLNHLGIYSDSQNYKELQAKIRDLWSQDNAYFLKCKNCDLHFAYPFISGDSEFYNLIYDDDSEYGHIWKWEFKIT